MKVFIPSAGIGSRISAYKIQNKALLPLNIPSISQILKRFPKDTEFVIALGYKRDFIRIFEACSLGFEHKTVNVI